MAARNDSVQVMVRLRPSDNPAKELVVQPDGKSIRVNLGKQGSGVDGGVNNQPHEWSFTFDGVLGPHASQEGVYDAAARDVVESVLQGFNGTVLAYGQTGAGKTYSITGPLNSYESRGITPRAIAHLFRAIEARPDMAYNLSLSYCEIYNEHLFDLLAERPPASVRNPSIAHNIDLAIQEDPQGSGVTVKGLVRRPVHSEQECLDELFRGESARSVGEHALNENSSRSHCIYTIYVEMRSRVESSEKVIHSKLNLVDLAGSERVGKTNSTGLLLTEAKFINKSLSALEAVVVALAQGQGSSQGKHRDRSHVPYRSSRLTHLLKDSLGGNTCTRVVATLHSDRANIPESLSTLKFAQRMRRVTNRLDRTANESLDPLALAQKLAREVRELKQELAMHDTISSRIGVSYEPYTPEESLALRRLIARYCAGGVDEIEIVNLRQVRETFRQFKNYVLEVEGRSGGAGAAGAGAGWALHSASSSPEPPQTPGFAGAVVDESQMVGEMDEAASGGFGIGFVSSASRPAPRPDSRDEPLKPSNIVRSRARAAAAAGNVTTAGAAGATMPAGSGSGSASAPRSRQAVGASQTAQLGSPSSSLAALKLSASPSSSGKTGGAAQPGRPLAEEKSNAGAFPPLRQATRSGVQTAPAGHKRGGSGSGSGSSASTEAAAFSEFKAGAGFDAAELCAAAKAEWSARRRELRAASLRVNELKRRIDSLSGAIAEKRSERLANGDAASAAAAGEVEVLDEEEYDLMQQSAAAKADYKALYSARLDVEAAALRAEQEVAEARAALFEDFAQWFREKFGSDPSTNVDGGAQSSPRTAAGADGTVGGRACRDAAASDQSAWEDAAATMDPEARSFLTATRNLERNKKQLARPFINGGRRPYVGAAFK